MKESTGMDLVSLNVFETNNEVDLYDARISMEVDYDEIFELLK